MSEINLWELDGDWEDEDGCYNTTMFSFTLQNKLYLEVTYWDQNQEDTHNTTQQHKPNKIRVANRVSDNLQNKNVVTTGTDA